MDLVERAMNDSRMRAALDRGDWYLVGSRALGFDDELSDWDTLLLCPTDFGDDLPTDEIFGIERPSGEPSLDLHRRWRGAHGVDVEVIGPAEAGRREAESLPIWAFNLAHAVPLRVVGRCGERYRERVAGRFLERRAELVDTEYAAFRRARNEAVSTLARPDRNAQLLTAAVCLRSAARLCHLTAGEPYPSDKWLLRNSAVATTPLDVRLTAEERFDALWELWKFVDARLAQPGA